MTIPALDPVVEFIRSLRMSQLFRDEVGWLWPLCESLHFLGLILLIGAAGFFDLRLLGFAARLPLEELSRAFRIMWIGFWINAVSGAVLGTSRTERSALEMPRLLRVQ